MFNSTVVFSSEKAKEIFYQACEYAPVVTKPGHQIITEEVANGILADVIERHFNFPDQRIPS